MLSTKEFVAIFLLLTALLCILNASEFGHILPTTTSYVQLAQQSVSSSTAYICILYALSTWLFHSNYSEPRQHIRLVFLCMLAIMMIGHLTVLVFTIKTQYFTTIEDSIDIVGINTGYQMTCRYVTIILTIISIILMLVVFIDLFLIAHRKRMEHKRRRINLE